MRPHEKHAARVLRLGWLRWTVAAWTLALLSGCATPTAYDYTAYRQARPQSILVLPPLNETVEVQASYGVLSVVTQPLSESGYYVLPVTLVDETFRENGLTQAADIHAVSHDKLREIFDADAALYLRISDYGTRFQLIDSVTVVSAQAKLVDLKTGALLWEGHASASSAENRNNQGGGLAGLLISAIVNQIIGTVSNQSQVMAGVTAQRLLGAGRPNGLLFGKRHPLYGQDK